MLITHVPNVCRVVNHVCSVPFAMSGMGPPWYGKLDLLATDYYPAKGVPHPDSGLPWQVAPGLDAAYAAAIEADMAQYAALSKYVIRTSLSPMF